MTITATTSKATFNGNDSATSFPFTFKILDQSHLVVVHVSSAGVETVKTITTDYTVSLNADQETNPGGTVTYPVSGSPLATGDDLIVYRNISAIQTTDMDQQGQPFLQVESALDWLTMVDQQQQNELSRSIKSALSDDAGINLTLPAASLRAGKYLAFNAGGAVTASSGTGTDSALRSDLADNSSGNGSELVTYTPSGAGAVATTVQDRIRQSISVLDYIPAALHASIRAGTNTTDLRAYIQAGIDHVESLIISPQGTPELVFPGGKYLIGAAGGTTGLDLKKANLKGSGAFGCTLVWGGDVDGTLIRYQPVFHKKISGFRFSSSNHPTNRPMHWFDCTWNPDSLPITTMDWGDSFWDLFFDDCSGTSGSAHLNLPDFTNLYMRDIRFQYAKHLVKVDVPTGASANRVFSIEDWTVDLHNSAFSHTDQPESLFQFDMTGAANISLVLRNARIEMTSLDMTGVKAIVEILDSKGPNAIPASGIGLVMENIGLQFSTATGVSLVYQNTTQTTVTSDILLCNVFLLGVAQIHGGNWNSSFTTPEPEDFSGRIKLWSTGRVNRFGQIQLGDIVTVGKEIRFGSGDTQVVLVEASPEGVITADRGSIAIRNNGSGGGFGFYVKTTDGVNTGWENASVYVGGGTGGTGSAGAGAQYVELNINGTTYKLLHDGTV